MATHPFVRFKLGAYLTPGSYKIAATLGDLVRQTNAFSTKNRGGCVPKLTGSNPKDLFLHYNVKCSLKSSDPAGHDVKVKFDPSHVTDTTKAKDLDVATSCTCPAFLYWGAQWNLHQQGALEGDPRPLLTAPTERLDLRNQFIICKHIQAVFERILPSVQHNIVKLVRERTVRQKKKEREEKHSETPSPTPSRTTPVPEPEATPATPSPTHVIQRDAPATPEERSKTPVIEETEVPEPQPEPVVPKSRFAPIPLIDDLEDEPEMEEPVVPEPAQPVEPSTPTPAATPPPAKVPQKPNNRPGPQDREFMKRLQREEQQRQQRQTQQRFKNNRGWR